MPTESYGKVRHMLKDGRAIIYKRNPFTIQLTYETTTYTKPMEVTEDTGYDHVGMSVKSEAKEYVSAQYDLLPDEKEKHDARSRYRRSRRNRLRHRKDRFLNRRGKKTTLDNRPITARKKKKVKEDLEKFRKYMKRHPDKFPTEEAKQEALKKWRARQSKTAQKVLVQLLDEHATAQEKSPPDSKAPFWLAPSLKNKVDRHVDLIMKYVDVCPIQDVYIEVGEFDTQLLKALKEGKPIPVGRDYQHGPKYQEETIRSAVFHRDGHKCLICGRGIKDGVVLRAHHMYYWRGQHGDSVDEMITVCEKCHTAANHRKGGKLWGLDLKVGRYSAPAFMNYARWNIYAYVRDKLTKYNKEHGTAVQLHMTYGAATKTSRIELGLDKSHSNDAFAMGQFHPADRATFEHYQKRRRNNRCLEKFYDAVYLDKDGKRKKGAELSCGRTNRKIPRNNPESMRKERVKKVSKGKRVVRHSHYPIPSGATVWHKIENRRIVVSGMHCNGAKVMWYVTDPKTGKKKQVSVTKRKVLAYKYPTGWTKVEPGEPVA